MKKFEVGQKVRIRAKKSASDGVKKHNGKIVTIKAPCEFYSKACYLKELDGLWTYGCFEEIKPLS